MATVIWQRYRPFVFGIAGAVLGGVLLMVIMHLWADHTALHVIVNYLNQQSAKINKLP